MYEGMTYEVILQSMLDRVPDTFDKREGSIIYDAIAPAAAELAQLYIELDVVLNQTFADTSTGEYLERRCVERGITRKTATYVVVQGTFTPANIDVTGQRFRCGDFYYVAASGSDGVHQMVCETSGSEPNGITGQLIPVDYVGGLETASITKILIPGEDAESDDDLRERYLHSISSQAFGGNVTDYIEKTNAIDGVGGVKVTPVWNGGGTVLLTIIASDYSVPTGTLIESVQKEMSSIAPIGHTVTVDGVVNETINITADITYQDGWDWSSTGTNIENAIDEYFLELAKTWDEVDNIMVRISGVEQKILACSGVLDVQNTTLNGSANNVQLGVHEIPTRGGVNNE